MPEIKTNAEQIHEKEDEYYDYIVNHIKGVIKAVDFLSSRVDIEKMIHESEDEFRKHLNTHDESKYSDFEFTQYRKKFYPAECEENDDKGDIQTDFMMACKHHYSVNPHHPEFYYDANGEPSEMPDIYIAEMICDWLAMSLMKCGSYESIGTWYDNQIANDKIKLAPNTKKVVDLYVHALSLKMKEENHE